MPNESSAQTAPDGQPSLRGTHFTPANVAWKVLLGTLVLIVTWLLKFIVPKFGQIFHDMLGNDASLSLLTRFILGASYAFKANWYFSAAALIVWAIVRLVIALFRRGRQLPLNRDTAARDRLLAALMSVLIIVVPAIIIIALFMPLITIIQSMPGH